LDVVREWTSLIHARTARFLRAITVDLSLRVAGRKSLHTDRHKAKAVRL